MRAPGRTCVGEAGGPAAATIGTPTPGGSRVAGSQHGSPLITRGPDSEVWPVRAVGRPFRDLASGILEADAAGGEAAD